MLRRPIKRHLISLSPSSKSLALSCDSFVNQRNAVTLPCTVAILSTILEFVMRFLWNLYNWCPVSLRTIQWKNEFSVLINDWITANYSATWPPFSPPSWNLLSDLCQTSTTHVCCHYAQFREKRSPYINKWLSHSQLLCFTAAILSTILGFVIGFVSNF